MILNKANSVFCEVLLVSLKCRFVLAEHEIKGHGGCTWEISRSSHILMLRLSFWGGFCIYIIMDTVWGARLSPAFLGTVRSILKDYFTLANFFLALLFRQMACRVSLSKAAVAFKREKLRSYTMWHCLKHFWLSIFVWTWIPANGSAQSTYWKYFT